MTVVRREARRRWLSVAAGVAVLCLLPSVIAFVRTPTLRVDPGVLRERVLSSGERPYQGYVSTYGQIKLPEVPAIEDVAALFGTMRLRSWYAGPSKWRVAIMSATGERDIYGTPEGTYAWDFEKNTTTLALGEPQLSLRPPNAADLVPPDLARRMLLAEPDVTAIAPRHIAGLDAAGLRINPTDPATTIGRVDIWADPDTGLALQVEVTPRGLTDPVFTSRFLDFQAVAPTADVLVPRTPADAGFVVTRADAVAQAINQVAPVPLPPTLLGRQRLGSPGPLLVLGLAAYGPGLSTFVVLALPGRTGFDALNTARDHGALPVQLAGASAAYETSTILVNGLIVRNLGDRQNRRTYLLAGTVDPEVLRQAAVELLGAR